VIDRRAFVAGTAAVLATPLGAGAQQPAKVWRIGFLGSAFASAAGVRVEALRLGLRELGYVEGRNLAIEFRWAEGNNDRLPALAAELVQSRVDVIVTQGTPATLAARRATTTIPIVFATAGDPVGTGIVASLSRPGGNITGLTDVTTDVAGKRLALLREAAPGVTRIAVLWNSSNPVAGLALKETEVAAQTLGLPLRSVEVRDVNRLDSAFSTIVRERAGAVVVLPDPALFDRRVQIAEMAAKNRLPSMAWTPEFAESGCLMIYGPSTAEMHRRAATYVDKILRGAKPADLPVEQPTKFELIINLKTAKTLGLTIPESLLRRADQVIQ
jgi:putative tryptophan/tyrosine transport system substrate-binding protein